MTQPRTMDPDSLQDLQVIDSEGSKVGKVDTIFLDTETNRAGVGGGEDRHVRRQDDPGAAGERDGHRR